MTSIYNKIIKLGTVGLIGAAALAGCASTESKMAVPYIVELKADSQVNPNASGKPSPIKITIYELKSTNAFDTANYFALMKDPQASSSREVPRKSRLRAIPRPRLSVLLHRTVT